MTDINLIKRNEQPTPLTHEQVDSNWQTIEDAINELNNTIDNSRYIISGFPIWSGVGLEYLYPHINYVWNGVELTAPQGSITLDTSDVSFDRFDLIVLSENGTVSVIKGTASDNPIIPTLPNDRLLLLTINVKAGMTEPNVISEIIYNENIEWATSILLKNYPNIPNDLGSIDFDSTNEVKVGAKSIHWNTNEKKIAIFKPASLVNPTNWTTLSMWIMLKEPINDGRRFEFQFYKTAGNAIGNYIDIRTKGLNQNLLNTWQLITIPIADFNIPNGEQIERLRATFALGSPNVVRDLYIDYIRLTTDVEQVIEPLKEFNVSVNGQLIGAVESINFIEDENIEINGTLNDKTADISIKANIDIPNITLQPAGSDTQIQYNNAGSFGADSNFFRDLVNNATFIANTDGADYLGGLQNDNGTSGIFSINTVTNHTMGVSANIGNAEVRLGNLSGGNGTSITIDDTAQTINFNNNYSFPFADGTAGQVLGTDGSGQLEWQSVSGGGGQIAFTKTKAEIDTLIAGNDLEANALYEITGVHPTLYDDGTTSGTTVYLRAISGRELEVQGMGKFYNPKYNQSVDGFGIWDNKMYGTFSGIVGTFDYQGKEAVTANNGATGLMLAQGMIQWVSGDWSAATSITGDASSATANIAGFVSPSYGVGDKVIWGGYSWTNVNGNVGASVDVLNLNAEWTKNVYDTTNYNIAYDVIEYDYTNDMIIRRFEKESNVDVKCSKAQYDIGTGTVPSHLKGEHRNAPNTGGAFESVQVKHVSGGWSEIYFKSYDSEVAAYSGASDIDFILLDEEPSSAIDAECTARIFRTGGLKLLSFTPDKGLSDTILQIFPDGHIKEGEVGTGKFCVSLTMDDVPH